MPRSAAWCPRGFAGSTRVDWPRGRTHARINVFRDPLPHDNPGPSHLATPISASTLPPQSPPPPCHPSKDTRPGGKAWPNPIPLIDGRFSPCGTRIAATDAGGQLHLFDCGAPRAVGSPAPSLMDRAPIDQFFTTDFRPIVHDEQRSVLDAATRLPLQGGSHVVWALGASAGVHVGMCRGPGAQPPCAAAGPPSRGGKTL